VSEFPEGRAREQAFSSLVSSWSSADPIGASQWLNSLPAGKSQERATSSFVSQIAYEYPELAAPLIDRISDQNQRTFTIENVANNWLRIDRFAAEQWLETTSLPQDRKARLLRQADR
jgi:hypothetical protein